MMAYTKINWKDGEDGGTPLSAANLNKMDNGIANMTPEIDGMPGQILSLDENGKPIWIDNKDESETSADKVSYDNASSGLSATKVQGAIDEILDTILNGVS